MVLGRIVGPVAFLFSTRRKVYKLRRKYDKLREKADKTRDRQKRSAVLSVLDQIEPNIVILEEQNVSRFERGRMMNFAKSGLRKAEEILKDKKYEKRKV
ncbi:MAG: hypothetical protein HYW27_00330 [Candidatus Aenigmarchaeota archaeon]|nr:hypothetical protein [Candidatus Aenigmarchaeota archaeon]